MEPRTGNRASAERPPDKRSPERGGGQARSVHGCRYQKRHGIQAALSSLLLSFPVIIAIYQGHHPPPRMGYAPDFAIFRTAAEMVRSGWADHLYDIEAQSGVFNAVVGSSYQFLVWNHPPFEALIYLPSAFW